MPIARRHSASRPWLSRVDEQERLAREARRGVAAAPPRARARAGRAGPSRTAAISPGSADPEHQHVPAPDAMRLASSRSTGSRASARERGLEVAAAASSGLRTSITPIRYARSPSAWRRSRMSLASSDGHDQHHADAAVEHAQHLGLVDLAAPLQPVEDRRPRPARRVDPRAARPSAARAARCRGSRRP